MRGSARRFHFVLLALGIAVTGAAWPVQAADNEYSIGPEDVLDVSVWQAPELGGKVIVSSAGMITLPLVGEIQAAGMTPTALARRLTEAYTVYKRDVARVTVRVETYNSRAIYVIGQVAKPGKYPFEEIPTVWDAIKEAGGPLQDAFLGEVRIVRSEAAEQRAIRVDVEGFLAGRSAEVPELRPGDTVVVPKSSMPGYDGLAKDVLYVEGEVVRPGSYSMGPARDLLGAVLLAGGFGPSADRSRVSLVRRVDGATIVRTVDVRRFQEEGDAASNPRVEPGDWISVQRQEPEKGFLGSVGSFARVLGPLLSLTAIVVSIAR